MSTLRLTEIQNLDDPRLEPYRDVRDRDLKGRHDGFIAEGVVVIEAALKSARFPLQSILIARNKVSSCAYLLSQVPRSVAVYCVDPEAMSSLVGFDIHRGVLAFGKRNAELGVQAILATLPAEATILVLEGLTNHDNVGASFRNAAALGASAVLLDTRCCDPLYRKAIRVSTGHTLTLPWARGSIEEILDGLGEARVCRAALSLDQHAEPLIDVLRPSGRMAVILGSEGPGLSAAALHRCDLHLRIPMAHEVDSLNVATAGAIALFACRAPQLQVAEHQFERRSTAVEGDPIEGDSSNSSNDKTSPEGLFERSGTKLESSFNRVPTSIERPADDEF